MNFKKAKSAIQYASWCAIIVGAALVLFGCARQNTIFSPGFNRKQFESLKVGITESEVVRLLGPGFYRLYHVKYPNGSENNVPVEPVEVHELLSYEIRYTNPQNEKEDFEVLGVVFDKEHNFIKINYYITD